MESETLRVFIELCRQALSASRRFDSSTDVEPFLLAVLDYIKLHREAREEFLLYFLAAFDGVEVVAAELHAFCMRELQWPEVRAKALQCLDRSNVPESEFWLKDVLSAYDANWDGDRLFCYYSRLGKECRGTGG